jgi:hypothetical protein
MQDDLGVKLSRYNIFQALLWLQEIVIEKGEQFSAKGLSRPHLAYVLRKKGYLTEHRALGNNKMFTLTERAKNALQSDTTLMEAILKEILRDLQDQAYALHDRVEYYQRILLHL